MIRKEQPSAELNYYLPCYLKNKAENNLAILFLVHCHAQDDDLEAFENIGIYLEYKNEFL